jgi:hypothetical protein
MVRAGSDERTFGEEFWMNDDLGIPMTTNDPKKMAETFGLLLIHALLPSVSALQRTTGTSYHPSITTCETNNIHDVSDPHRRKCCRTRIAWGTTHNSYIYSGSRYQQFFPLISSECGILISWYRFSASETNAKCEQGKDAFNG